MQAEEPSPYEGQQEEETKAIWRSRTFWLNLLIIVVPILDLTLTTFELTPEVARGVLFLIGVIGIILRAHTTEGVSLRG